MSHSITLVTALYDMKRDGLNDSFKRSFDHYLNNFKNLLNLEKFPMIIYCDVSLNDFVWKYRKKHNTKIINKPLSDFNEYPHYSYVQTIRHSHNWREQAQWLSDSPQSQLEYYNPLVMAKQFLLNDASIINTFSTKYFLWIDAGISHTVNISDYFNNNNVVNQLSERLNKMLYIAFPYKTTTEIHGFEKSAIDKFAESDVTRVVRGGLFGGTREAIASINEVYYHTLLDTLRKGFMGTEESIFSILSYKYKHLINLEMIENNGLIYNFFEKLKRNKTKLMDYDDNVALYVLTYNSPKQFKLWAESFFSNYSEFGNKCPKYVLNNSDEPSVNDEYLQLFKQYNFIELKYDNIGITGGRIEIAKHFSNTKHKFMIFFEDDMLIRGSVDPAPSSGLGGNPVSFEHIKDILTFDNLDYIKLSFDEYYGNNATNWAWYHTSVDEKQKYFPDIEPNTFIKYIKTYKQIPYAVGDFFYCNWPIMITQDGNKKIFLNDNINKHEGALMYRSLKLHRDDKLLMGCLLSSMIFHNRKYHYKASKRKES